MQRSTDSRIIESPSLVDAVRQHLIQDIMERKFHQGQKLPVVEIAAMYGVSETPVKQAFHRLVAEGLLVALPRRGVMVRRVSVDDIRELMEARHMVNLVSVDAVISAVQDPGSDVRSRLKENLAEHAAILHRVTDKLAIDVLLQYVRVDRDYHLIYLECVNNRTIERIFHQLHHQSYAFVSLSGLMAQRIRDALEQHTAIYETYLTGRRQEIIEELMRHRDGAINMVNQLFD
jgi:DNA-binding GntR family transcriptional regulator